MNSSVTHVYEQASWSCTTDWVAFAESAAEETGNYILPYVSLILTKATSKQRCVALLVDDGKKQRVNWSPRPEKEREWGLCQIPLFSMAQRSWLCCDSII